MISIAGVRDMLCQGNEEGDCIYIPLPGEVRKYTRHPKLTASSLISIMKGVFSTFIIAFLATNATVFARPTEKRQNDVPACVDGSGNGSGPYTSQ